HNPQVTYVWNDLTNGINNIANTPTLQVGNFGTTTQYQVIINDGSQPNNCESTDLITVEFYTNPIAEITFNGGQVTDIAFCDVQGAQTFSGAHPSHGANIQYEWRNLNTNQVTLGATLNAANFSSTVTYELKVIDASQPTQCFRTDQVTVTFYPQPITQIKHNNVAKTEEQFCNSDGAQTLNATDASHTAPFFSYEWFDVTNGVNLGNTPTIQANNFAPNGGAPVTTIYRVNITDSRANCVNTAEIEITFYSEPLVDGQITASQDEFCEGGTIDLNIADTEGDVSYRLIQAIQNGTSAPTTSTIGTQMGNGTTLTFAGLPLTTTLSTGITTYTYTVEATRTLPNGETCVQMLTDEAQVRVYPKPTVTLNGNATICVGETANVSFVLTGNFPMQLSYSVTDTFGITTVVNETIGVATTQSPQTFVINTGSGIYQALSLQDAYCTGDIPNTIITVNAIYPPVMTLSADDLEICAGETTTFTATGATNDPNAQIRYIFYINGLPLQDGTLDTYTPAPNTLQNGDVIKVVGYVVGDNNPCAGTSNEIVLTVNPNPTVDIGVDRFKCVGDTAIIVATLPEPTNFIYDWRKYDFDNDIWAQVGNGNDTLFALDTGWYKVRLQNVTTGCEGFSNAVFIYDYDTLKVDLGQDRRVCDPSDLPFRLVAADLSHPNSVVYEWYETGDNTILGTDSTYDAPQEGFYSVIVKDLVRGCEVRDTVRIQLKPDPDFELLEEQNQDCADEKRLYIEATNIENMLISWTFSGIGTGIVSVSNDNLSAIVNQAGTYTVTVSDTTFGVICTLSKSINVNIRPRLNVAGATLPNDEIVACQTDTLRFDAFNFTHEPDYEYLWRNLATAEVVSDNSNVEIVFEDSYTPTRFEIQVTDAAGCQVRDTITVRFERQSQVEILET
ncbi:hypothetical protein, partial [Hugenholtzia roseola]|uniref:hypothetical protein n=1 Tax=Hugenholtzia roseola TaxID=1002 RepID=UPI00055561F6